MPLSKIGVAGLTARGRAIGGRLRASGFRVLGFDHDVQAAATSGLRTVSSTERLEQECEVAIVACDGEAATALTSELLKIPGRDSLSAIVLAGALQPRLVQRLAASAAEQGMALIDAPMDGGEDAISAGRAVIFAGGSQQALHSCANLFAALGSLVRVGQAGSGQVARTVNDLLRWANVVAIHDAFGLARACGADLTAIREAVLRASGSNRALEEGGASGIEAARQDLQAALLLADETGAGMPFLRQLDGQLAGLNPDEMSGLVSPGVLDLTTRGSDDA